MSHGPRIARAIERFAVGSGGPHVIHGFGVWSYAGTLAARRLRRAGARVRLLASSYTTYAEEAASVARGVGTAHGARTRLRFRAQHGWILLALGRYEREAYEGADEVLVNYESVRRLLRARYRVEGRCRIVPYTSASAFRPLAEVLAVPADVAALEPRGAPLLVSVSRQEPRKGVDVFLHALAALRRDGVPFRAALVAGGPLLDRHRRLAVDLGLAGSVTLPGVVPDVEPYLAAADVYVLPSHGEQSGSLALIEALRRGRPTVASGCDGILEDLVAERDALLVEPGHVPSLTEALRRLLADAGLRSTLAARARAVFDARFSPDVMAAALRGVYEEEGAAIRAT
jgi:glycosyltransferase involved in cell wall biosynthesis